MGFYSRFVFPRLCDRPMGVPRWPSNGAGAGRRARRHPRDRLRHGLNLAYYPEHVRRITAVDPNPGMNALAAEADRRSGIEVDRRRLGGEALPFDEETFDCVVSTWTMCSIPEVGHAWARCIGCSGRAVGSSSWSTA